MRRHLRDGGERDLVPPYWVPVKFGGTKGWVSPKVFFQEILSNNPPRSVHPGDLENVKPWWDLLDRSREPCLRAIDGPLILGIDPDETTEDRLARETDHGSNHHATNRINAERARAEAKKSKKARVQQRREALLAAAAAAAGPEPNCHNPRPIKSEVNGLYIRSAKPADMLRAKDIYNHHVNSTCCTPENGGIHDDDMIRRYHGVHAEGYPFIVACEKGAKIPPRRSGKDRHGNPDAIALPDKIIGFACADHHHHPLGQFTSTSQLQVFVHRDYLMKGVGSCLMDKMLTLLDPTHVGRGEYEVVGADMDGMGAKTRVRNLILDFPFDRPQTLEWFGRWMRGMGFAQAGMLVDVGVTGTRRWVCALEGFVAKIFFPADGSDAVSPSPYSSVLRASTSILPIHRRPARVLLGEHAAAAIDRSCAGECKSMITTIAEIPRICGSVPDDTATINECFHEAILSAIRRLGAGCFEIQQIDLG